MAGGLDPLDRERLFVERSVAVSGGILDRKASDAGGDAECRVGGNAFGCLGETAQEIGIDRKRRGGAISRICASISSRGTAPSAVPRLKENPAEVVASALNPRRCK